MVEHVLEESNLAITRLEVEKEQLSNRLDVVRKQIQHLLHDNAVVMSRYGEKIDRLEREIHFASTPLFDIEQLEHKIYYLVDKIDDHDFRAKTKYPDLKRMIQNSKKYLLVHELRAYLLALHDRFTDICEDRTGPHTEAQLRAVNYYEQRIKEAHPLSEGGHAQLTFRPVRGGKFDWNFGVPEKIKPLPIHIY
jgi:hypothetical protein